MKIQAQTHCSIDEPPGVTSCTEEEPLGRKTGFLEKEVRPVCGYSFLKIEGRHESFMGVLPGIRLLKADTQGEDCHQEEQASA
jgi:hypothetical protein